MARPVCSTAAVIVPLLLTVVPTGALRPFPPFFDRKAPGRMEKNAFMLRTACFLGTDGEKASPSAAGVGRRLRRHVGGVAPCCLSADDRRAGRLGPPQLPECSSKREGPCIPNLPEICSHATECGAARFREKRYGAAGRGPPAKRRGEAPRPAERRPLSEHFRIWHNFALPRERAKLWPQTFSLMPVSLKHQRNGHPVVTPCPCGSVPHKFRFPFLLFRSTGDLNRRFALSSKTPAQSCGAAAPAG